MTETHQPVDEAATRAAKTLLRTARHGALAALDPSSGAPIVSRISLATEPDGSPIFLISQLAPHFAALEADGCCSLLIGVPGKGDPLAHPRLALSGHAVKLDGEARGLARSRFLMRQPKAALYADFADFAFWRITPERADYYGGYAKAYEMTAQDLKTAGDADLAAMEAGAVAHMNDDHLDAIAHYAVGLLGREPGPWRLASMDVEGFDLVNGDDVARLWFDPPLKSAKELRPRLVQLARRDAKTSADQS
ncbi:MAG: DUF2470 domain-containing protein [Pseudomonadota bacterium]